MLQVSAGPGQPRSLRALLSSPARSKALAAALFGLAGLLSAAVAWLATGIDTHPIVLRAVATPGIAGVVLGLLCEGWLRRGKALVSGAACGVLVHPVTWALFVVWANLDVWFRGGTPRGNLLQGLSNALVWSVASVAYGFLLTVPAFVLAAWAWTRLNPPPSPCTS